MDNQTHSTRLRILQLSLILMGVGGLIGQIVLLRELLISFYGNEITLGIILANWLLIEALGSFWIGKSVEKTTRREEIYGLIQLIFSVAFPAALYLSRIFRNSLVPFGEAMGFTSILISSFIVLLPVSLSHGALFTYGCRLYSDASRQAATSIGKVYILETVGTLFGGVIFTFVLANNLTSFQIAFGISLANAVMTLILLWPNDVRRLLGFRNGLWSVSIVFSILFGCLLFPRAAAEIDRASVQSRWRGMEVVQNKNSIYGNVVVTRQGEQYTFFTDGIASMILPVPDIASIEDTVHFPMLFHESPETVLVLHGGAGGVLHEILKYPVARVDYVELDPLVLRLVQRFSTPLTRSELSDNRVKIHYEDGRHYLRKTPLRYDAILIGLPSPQELQSNRVFTKEFLLMAKRRMTRNGIVALTLPGSLTYLTPDLASLNRCILSTLRSVFGHVRVIPGETHLYLASDSNSLETLTAQEIVMRFKERKIAAKLFTTGYIESRLEDRWVQWFRQSLGDVKAEVNSDFRPVAVFYSLSHWNALFSPYLAGTFRELERVSLRTVLLFIVVLTLCIAALLIRRPNSAKHALGYSVFTSGFTAMLFELAIILTFQTVYGYLYQQVGLLVAVFMAGVALGGIGMTRRLCTVRNQKLLFLKTETGIILFSFLLPFLFIVPSSYIDRSSVSVLLFALFLTSCLVSGVLIGLQFPLAAGIYLGASSGNATVGRTASRLYGADLLGGFFGGLFGGVLLLPVLGLERSCFAAALIKLSSFGIFALSKRLQRA